MLVITFYINKGYHCSSVTYFLVILFLCSYICLQEPVKRESRTEGGSTSYPCSFQDCKGKELLPVICPQCEKHFCLAYVTSFFYLSVTFI